MAATSNEVRNDQKNEVTIQNNGTLNQLSNTPRVTIKNKMLLKDLINTQNAQKSPQNITNSLNRMTKVMNPLIKVTNPLTKVILPQNKVTNPKDKGTNLLSIIKKKLQSLKNMDVEEKPISLRKVRQNDNGEFHPQHGKRNLQPKKVMLQPQPTYRVVATTNKRKRHIPHRGISPHILTPLKLSQESTDSEMLPRVESPSPLYQSQEIPELSLAELVKLAEEEELDDEDFMEILTCPSPVWWEEDSLDEDDLDEDLEEETSKQDKSSIDLNEGEESTDDNVNNNKLKTDARLFKKFFTKRSKLENVLGNIKNKQIRIEDDVVINDVIFIEDNENLIKNKEIVEHGEYKGDVVKNDDNTELKVVNNNKEVKRIHNIKFMRNGGRNKQIQSVDNDDIKEIEILDDNTKELTTNDDCNETAKLIGDHNKEHAINNKDHNHKEYKNNNKFGNRKRKPRLASFSDSINEDLLNDLETIEIPVKNIIGKERKKQETTQNIVMMEIVNKPIVNNEQHLMKNKRKRTRNPKYYNDSTLSGIYKVNKADKAIKEDTKQVDIIKHEDVPLDLPPLTKNPFKNVPKGFGSPKSIESGNSETSLCEYDSISDTNIKFLDEYVADETKQDCVNVKKYAKVNDTEFITVYQVVNGKMDSMDLDIEEHIKANLVNKSPQTEVTKSNGEIDSYFKPLKSFNRKSRAKKKNS